MSYTVVAFASRNRFHIWYFNFAGIYNLHILQITVVILTLRIITDYIWKRQTSPK